MPIYLDNAATSFPKPDTVYSAVMQAMQQNGGSPGRGGYGGSLDASRLLLDCREAIASLMNVADSSRVVFTNNATAALNQAVKGVLQPGDHVITSSMEHNSLLRPLFQLEKLGVELDIVQADQAGVVNPASLRKMLRKNSRMIAISHVSNVTGTVQDIASVAAICKEAGLLFLLDAAQSAGGIEIDMQRGGIHLLAAPGHKGLMGPQGTGFLAVAPDVVMRPLLAGGTGGNSDQDQQPDDFPEGFEAGTHNMPGIAGLGAAVRFVQGMGVKNIGRHEHELAEYARNQLAGIDGCRLYGSDDVSRRSSVVSFNIKDHDPALFAFCLDREHGIAVRAGLHCAPNAHRSIGSYPGGTVRISPGWFNSLEQIDIFCDAVRSIIRKGLQ